MKEERGAQEKTFSIPETPDTAARSLEKELQRFGEIKQEVFVTPDVPLASQNRLRQRAALAQLLMKAALYAETFVPEESEHISQLITDIGAYGRDTQQQEESLPAEFEERARAMVEDIQRKLEQIKKN